MTTSSQLIDTSTIKNNTNSNTQTPPSSYCGSECLYNTLDLPLHKFFNATTGATTTTTAKTDYCCDSLDQKNGPGLTPSWSFANRPSSSTTSK
eukprot:CAMPEP_0201941492 /NCGR_PEP_ID=MMETSP0903-20130614/47243_1 /ASSEMBLY_ACC=CAM_ASM_000552 /TAXON_ID=420261 /ORGANISM="Thalassiosira antarctica, Strain CCMP982" /LENGTH=92 /DNA_ID=CAMNT_0048483573 /DNA_START=74 /DNA_END=349 /DNA_ORIENTATION=-